ncbi:MAG: FAD:protein FMN transferase [Planctomycetota bacterium]|nr:FAD:protein FMN transferase [Planctomycetota bacterium]MDP6764234.1 FAD:protein FMN transferase [Planctomycetota bacterium]
MSLPRPPTSSLAALVWLLGACATAQLAPYTEARTAMGTRFSITVYAPDHETARDGLEAAFARIESLDARLSDYDPHSELSRLSLAPVGEAVAVSEDLWRVLTEAERVHALSGGAFDVSVGALSRLWRSARRHGSLPDPERLERALAATGAHLLTLDPTSRAVRLHAEGMRLDLGGIAKGFALDEALAALRSRGLPRAMVDGGGDLLLGQPPPRRAAWRVAVETGAEAGSARVRLELANAAVATSGDGFRHAVIDGVRISHVIDPRTGAGLTDSPVSTVVAPSGMLADAWASALCVLGPTRGLKVLESLPDVEARLVCGKGARARSFESAGFPAAVVSSPPDGRP